MAAEQNNKPVEQMMADEAAPQPAKPSFPEGGLHGWLAVLGCWSMMFCTFGYINAFGVYQDYYKAHFLADYTESDISWIGSIQAFFLMASGLVSGPICDRYGPKPILLPCTLIFVVSIMLNSLCTKYYQFMLAQGILGGLSNGLTYTPAVAIIGHYFQRRRPLAMGLASSGSSLGGVIYPIALNRLLNHTTLGFGWSVRIIGFLTLFMCIITSLSISARAPPRTGPHFLPEAFKRPTYTLQIIATFLIFWGMLVPFFYIPSYAVAHGQSVTYAYYLIAILNAPSLVGRILAGAVANRIGRYNTYIACSAICAVLLFCWIAARARGGITAFAALYGFFSGGIFTIFPTTLAMAAPQPNQIGTYVGMALGIYSLATLTGTPIVGAMVAKYGEYTQGIVFAGVVTAVGAGFVVATKVAFAGKKLVA